MNSAIQNRVRGAALAIAGGLFDEHTVRSVLTDLREGAERGSALREIADFVVHPSERDRGPCFETIARQVRDFVAYFRGKALHVTPTFSAEQLIDEMVERLKAVGVPADVCDQVRAKTDEIITSIFSLAQGATIKVDQTSAEVLLIADDKGRLALAFEFPIDDLKIPGLKRKDVKAMMPLISSNVPAPGPLRVIGLSEVARGPDGKLSLRKARFITE